MRAMAVSDYSLKVFLEERAPTDGRADPSRTYLYLVCDDADTFKVGISANPRQRLSSIQAHSPRPLSLVTSVLCGPYHVTRDIERWFLAALNRWSVVGEWFRADGFAATVLAYGRTGKLPAFIGRLQEELRTGHAPTPMYMVSIMEGKGSSWCTPTRV